ncbi:MAG TPA: hypothetical protein VFY93_08240 [Planctomycetota bacterium]|nr:hypothetical protein [Planctomycetota bacterium]
MILTQLLDDCWEPTEAVALLRRLAKGGAGTPSCLRVDRAGARVVGADFAANEPFGAASYLWVLWTGAPPTVAEMLALHDEHVRVVRGDLSDQLDGSTMPRRSSSDPSIL